MIESFFFFTKWEYMNALHVLKKLNINCEYWSEAVPLTTPGESMIVYFIEVHK